MQLQLELLLQAAEACVVDAHITQHLRGDFVVRVEALKFFLEVDALEGKRLYFGSHFRRYAPRNPGKVAPRGEARGNLLLGVLRVVGVGVDNCSQCMSCRLPIFHF